MLVSDGIKNCISVSIVSWLQTGCLGFNPQQRQMIFPLASVSRPALRPTQPRIQWVLVVLSLGVKCDQGVMVTTHPHLLLRSVMSRSYNFCPPCCLHGSSRTALLLLYMNISSKIWEFDWFVDYMAFLFHLHWSFNVTQSYRIVMYI
jgi:hypothetical protein